MIVFNYANNFCICFSLDHTKNNRLMNSCFIILISQRLYQFFIHHYCIG